MSEEALNAGKKKIDAIAEVILGLDRSKLLDIAKEVAKKTGPGARVVVCGAAGAGKTVLGRQLAKLLEVPSVDLDELIPGGWTKDSEQYRQRLLEGREALWDKLPAQGGWVVEHVEACSETMRKTFKPKYALLLKPGTVHIAAVSKARDEASGSSESNRLWRAMHSAVISKQQFDEAEGSIVASSKSWSLKKLG